MGVGQLLAVYLYINVYARRTCRGTCVYVHNECMCGVRSIHTVYTLCFTMDAYWLDTPYCIYMYMYTYSTQ